MLYDVDILSEIEEGLDKIFDDDLLKILSMLNRKNQLDVLSNVTENND